MTTIKWYLPIWSKISHEDRISFVSKFIMKIGPIDIDVVYPDGRYWSYDTLTYMFRLLEWERSDFDKLQRKYDSLLTSSIENNKELSLYKKGKK
jgi:hypothetical protein